MNRVLGNLFLFWLVLAIPAALMLGGYAASGFDAGKAFELVHGSGEFSVRLMLVAMAVSPLIALFGRRGWTSWLLRRRRALGVAACLYGVLHLGFYLHDTLDGGGWALVGEEAFLAAFWTGYAGLLIFAAMALTSNNSAQRAMGRAWKRLQRLVYIAAPLIALHWVLIDNGWRGAAVHFTPLAVLELLRIAGVSFAPRGQSAASHAA